MLGFCDFCGEKKELYQLEEATVCLYCRHRHLMPEKRYKTLPAKPEDFGQVNSMSEKTYGDYLRANLKTPVIGHLD